MKCGKWECECGEYCSSRRVKLTVLPAELPLYYKINIGFIENVTFYSDAPLHIDPFQPATPHVKAFVHRNQEDIEIVVVITDSTKVHGAYSATIKDPKRNEVVAALSLEIS